MVGLLGEDGDSAASSAAAAAAPAADRDEEEDGGREGDEEGDAQRQLVPGAAERGHGRRATAWQEY